MSLLSSLSFALSANDRCQHRVTDRPTTQLTHTYDLHLSTHPLTLLTTPLQPITSACQGVAQHLPLALLHIAAAVALPFPVPRAAEIKAQQRSKPRLDMQLT